MTKLVPGLCSVTFRQLGVDEVIDVASRAELQAIEWGADVHVRPGDPAYAARVREQCAEVGLACPSYGTYFFAGKSPDTELAPLLDNADALGATTVRAWAPGDPRPQYWHESVPVVEALRRACDRAAEHDLAVAVEFHPDTLTATARSTRELLSDVDRPNFRTYWQPVPGATSLHALTEIDPVLSHLQNLHVFSWNDDRSRLPLVAHEALWRAVLAKVAAQPDDGTACAYLEFVESDDPAVLARDGAALRSWIDALS
jgi:sugar phosphate isomerase/epimerase